MSDQKLILSVILSEITCTGQEDFVVIATI